MSVENWTHLLARRRWKPAKTAIGIESKIFSQLNYAKKRLQFHLPLFHYRYFSVFCARVNDGDKIYWHERQSTYKTINRQFATWSMIRSTMALIRIEGKVLTIAGRKKAAEKLINKKKCILTSPYDNFLHGKKTGISFCLQSTWNYHFLIYMRFIPCKSIHQCDPKAWIMRVQLKKGGIRKFLSFMKIKWKKNKPQRLLSWTYGWILNA